MKKSAIYLGSSAAILAIAGAFSTKGSTKVKINIGWTIGCTYTVLNILCANTEMRTCKTTNGTTLYTKSALGVCQNKLHTGLE